MNHFVASNVDVEDMGADGVVPGVGVAADGGAAAFVCSSNDTIWRGIEKCLDNGYGIVFVTEEAGVVTGQVDMPVLRAAIAAGRHLGHLTMKDVAVAFDPADPVRCVRPVLDGNGRVATIVVDSERSFLPVAEPDLSHLEFRNVVDAFLSTWISSTGDYVRTFEEQFAELVGVSHGVATSNGTVSLQLALAALDIGEGDEVMVPDFTFAASANAIIHAGARPVLVDIDPDTWCMSPDAVRSLITPRTRAIMPVHVFGRPAPMGELVRIAEDHDLYVIEDCAEAHGATYDGNVVGSFSHIACYSFFANKILTTGEGGMCLTDDPDIAARLRVLRDHGMNPARRYWHDEVGFNFRMTNLQAAIGCAQILRMDALLETRRQVHALYLDALSGIDDVCFAPALGPRHKEVTWFSCVTVPPEARDALIGACREENIDLRPFFNSLSAMPAFRRFARACPNSTRLAQCGVNLPTSHRVSAGVVERIATIFERVLSQA